MFTALIKWLKPTTKELYLIVALQALFIGLALKFFIGNWNTLAYAMANQQKIAQFQTAVDTNFEKTLSSFNEKTSRGN